MVNYTGLFDVAISELVDIIPIVLPFAIGIYAIFLGVRISKKTLTGFDNDYDIDTPRQSFTREGVEKYYNDQIKPHV